MKNRKINAWLIIALIAVLITAILSLIFGQGELNMGAFKPPKTKVARETKKVAVVECPGRSESKDGYCIYTLERPLDYYIVKDGSNFVVYGPNLTQLYKDLNLDRTENTSLPVESYAISRSSFTFKNRNSNGENVPSLVLENLDQATIDNLKNVRFIEVKVAGQTKVRLNTFTLPTKEIRAI